MNANNDANNTTGRGEPPLRSGHLARGIAPVGSVRRAFAFEHQTGAGLPFR